MSASRDGTSLRRVACQPPPNSPQLGLSLLSALWLLNDPNSCSAEPSMPGDLGGGGHEAPCPNTLIVLQTFGLLDLMHHV